MGNPVNGLTPVFVKENAERVDGPFITKVLEKTRKLNLAAVFTAFLRENNRIFNVAILVEKGKIKALYKKIHLFDAFGYSESSMFSPGNKIAIAKIKGFKIGLAVCFDLRFPELFRAMAYKGVDLFIVPSAWYKGKFKVEQWQVLTLSRAHENGAYLVGVDQTNPFFIGHSIITSPFATVIKRIGEEERSFVVELDYERLLESRKLIPILSLSKPDIYRTF
jgi:predicted amidohydrolase